MIDKYKPLIAVLLWCAMIVLQAAFTHAAWEPEASLAITAILTALHYPLPTSTTPAAPTQDTAK